MSESAPLEVLDRSLRWYVRHATRSKFSYFASETLLLAVGASIPVTAAFTSSRAVPAVLGGVVVVLAGLRPIFHWREDWLRLMSAATQLTTARELYLVGGSPYAGADRDVVLVREVRAIETAELEGWVRSRTPPTGDDDASGT